MVIHGDEDVVPPDVAGTVAAVASDAVARLIESAELLYVDVQQLTRVFALVPLYGLSRPEIAQAGQPGSAQLSTDSRFGHVHV